MTYFHVLISGPRVIFDGLSFGSTCKARCRNFRRMALSTKPPPNFILPINSVANLARCLGSNRPKRVLAFSSLSRMGSSDSEASGGKFATVPVFDMRLSGRIFWFVASSGQLFLKKVAPFWKISHKAKPYAHISHLGRSTGSIGDKSWHSTSGGLYLSKW